LGNGEHSPKIKSNRQKWEAFQKAARKIQEEYTAYVICDYESPVNFTISNGKLILTGEPVWCYVHCNKAVTDSVESILRQQVKARKEELYEKETGSSHRSDDYHQVNARVCQKLLKEFTEAYIEKRRADLIDSFPEVKRLHILKQYSSKMTALIRRYRDMNAEVYDALTTTMRYAAFFRWVKSMSPLSIQMLLDSYSYTDPVGILKTPSILVVSE